MFGWTLIKKADLAALEDESHLLRSTGYFVENVGGRLRKGFNGRAEIYYRPEDSPWRKSDSYRKIRA